MPVKRRLLKERAELRPCELAYLFEVGRDFLSIPDIGLMNWNGFCWLTQEWSPHLEQLPDGNPGARVLWAQYGEAVILEWVKENAGSRPQPWWRFSSPEPMRMRLGGTGEVDDRWATVDNVRYRGVPTRWVGVDPRDPPFFESEASYLSRHGLLTATERRQLTDADFEPEEIDVGER